MTLQEIVKQDAAYVRNSGYSISIVTNIPWVDIQHESGVEELSIFLQGDDAMQFIAEYDKLIDMPGMDIISFEDLKLATARPYIECVI